MNRPPQLPPKPRSDPDQGYPTNQLSSTYDISGAATDYQLIAMWLAGRPENTQRAYTTDINRLVAAIATPLRQVTAAQLVGYAGALTDLAPATQHRHLSTIKSLFSYAHRLGYLVLDPAAALRLPKLDTSRSILSAATIRDVLEHASPGRDQLLLRTLYLTGIREAELVTIAAADINKTPHGHALTVQGKGNKQRTIALPGRLASDLLAHRDTGHIFQTVRGNQLNVSDVYRIVRAAGEAAGHRITPHGLRHACASHALDNGAPLHVVRDTLGHKSLSVTSVYVHSKPSDSAGLYLDDQVKS